MRHASFASLVAAVLLCAAYAPAGAEPVPEVAPTSRSQTAPAHLTALAQAQATLAFELVRGLAAAKGAPRTLTVSPASLVAALGPVAAAGDDRLRHGLAKALGVSAAPNPLELLAEARAALRAAQGAALRSADRLVFPPAAAPGPLARSLVEALKAPYAVEDLSDPAAVAAVNGWVKEQTGGLVPEILPGPLDRSAFVALNALHFKARWQTVFDPRETAAAPFRGSDGSSGSVMMMRLPEAERRYRQEGRFVAVDLPFAEARFSLVVVTTTDAPAKPEGFAKAAAWLAGEGFGLRRGDLALPRFTASGSADLLPVLDGLGALKDGRGARGTLALLAPVATLSQVLQRAMIEVTEEGAEAAAATAAVTMRSFEPPDSLRMVVDRPFLYALRDRDTGLVLVAGYVGEAPKGKV